MHKGGFPTDSDMSATFKVQPNADASANLIVTSNKAANLTAFNFAPRVVGSDKRR